jgi:hypothetical protein
MELRGVAFGSIPAAHCPIRYDAETPLQEVSNPRPKRPGHLCALITLSWKHYRVVQSLSEGPSFSNSFEWLRRWAAFTNSDTASRLTLSYLSPSEIERESISNCLPRFSAASAASWMSRDCDVSRGVDPEDTYVLFRNDFSVNSRSARNRRMGGWRFEHGPEGCRNLGDLTPYYAKTRRSLPLSGQKALITSSSPRFASGHRPSGKGSPRVGPNFSGSCLKFFLDLPIHTSVRVAATRHRYRY